MITEKETKNISKFLSYVLRHHPGLIGIELDVHGWANVDELITKANTQGHNIDREILDHVVDTNSKKRFAFDEHKQNIRASQGHSIEVELGYQAQIPPKILYHGTGEGSVSSIKLAGLQKRDRHHVHLSEDVSTAKQVGSRHGKPAIFMVKALDMHNDGHLFYVSENNVWLVDHVPTAFLELMDR